MSQTPESIDASAPLSCPVSGMAGTTDAARRFVDPDDELVLPMHQRVIAQYAKDAAGITELRLFYGDKEISFDEPELFTFGETLARQSRFIAKAATQWGRDLTWPKVQGLLEQLVEEGVLQYAADPEAVADAPPGAGARPSPLPPATATVARTWADSVTITREITGRELDPAYLELVIPIFRVVHMLLDADGRQVGEANVFPKALRLDVPTNWRACIYPGSRYMDEKPMNVTALKAMRAHWGAMMACVLHMREGYLRRFPGARNGWTVGDLERLSTVILALPTYLMMHAANGVENGKLHPVLSSLFRVTDGVRMTMHQMLFIPIGEPTMLPDAPMTGAGILDYAERNHSFHSEFGVCAGPRAMMEEFMAVLVDGRPARNADTVVLDAEVQAALAQSEAAIEYGLYGLQAYACVFSLWPVMTRTYERVYAIVQAWRDAAGAGCLPKVAAFVQHLDGFMANLRTATYLGTEQHRVDREKVYADMYHQCGRGLGQPDAVRDLTARIAPYRDTQLAAFAQRLQGVLARYFECAQDDAHLVKMLDSVVDFVAQEQAILREACATQQHINALLRRDPPATPFSARAIDIHVLLQGRDARQVPNLGDELERLLGIEIEVTEDRVAIID